MQSIYFQPHGNPVFILVAISRNHCQNSSSCLKSNKEKVLLLFFPSPVEGEKKGSDHTALLFFCQMLQKAAEAKTMFLHIWM